MKKVRLVDPDGHPIYHRIIYGRGRFDEVHTDPVTGIVIIYPRKGIVYDFNK